MEWIISAIVLLGGIAGYVIFRLKKVKHPSCPICRYYLHSAVPDRCSECGAELAEVGIQMPRMVNSHYLKHRLVCGFLIVGAAVSMIRAASMPWLKRVFEEPDTAVFSVLADGPGSGEYGEVRISARYAQYTVAYAPIMEVYDIWVEMLFDKSQGRRHSVLWVLDRSQDNGRIPHPWRAEDSLQFATAVVLDWMNDGGADISSDAVKRESEDIAHEIKMILYHEGPVIYDMPSFGDVSVGTTFERPRIKLGWRVVLELLWLGLFGVIAAVLLLVQRRRVDLHRDQCRLAYAERALSATTTSSEAASGGEESQE